MQFDLGSLLAFDLSPEEPEIPNFGEVPNPTVQTWDIDLMFLQDLDTIIELSLKELHPYNYQIRRATAAEICISMDLKKVYEAHASGRLPFP